MPVDYLIVGGGLAGLSSAHQLNRAGRDVMLLEKRSRLGGRASSYELDSFPLEIDNCQHVLTGSCRECLKLIRATAGSSTLEIRREIPVLSSGPHPGVETWKIGRGPVPFHLYPMWRQAHRSFADAIRNGVRLGTLFGTEARNQTAMDWLRRHQSKEIIEHLWRPLTTSALNETLERVSLSMFRKWVITGMLQDKMAPEIYIPSRSLKDLYGNQVGRELEKKGVTIRRNCRVQKIEPKTLVVELEGGERLKANHIISALPDRVLWARLPESVRGRFPFDQIPGWDHAPIISVHLYFEESFELPEFAMLADSPFEWLFALRQPEEGTYAQCVKSAAWDAQDWTKQRLVSEATEAIRSLLPASVNPVETRIVKEKNATLSMTAVQEQQRFGPDTPFPRFAVAGDWIQQSWPPTMESAVRSGIYAAHHLSPSIPPPANDPAPPIPLV